MFLSAFVENHGLARGAPFSGLRSHKEETFEKCSILVKFKEGENFNHRNTLSILRIEI